MVAIANYSLLSPSLEEGSRLVFSSIVCTDRSPTPSVSGISIIPNTVNQHQHHHQSEVEKHMNTKGIEPIEGGECDCDSEQISAILPTNQSPRRALVGCLIDNDPIDGTVDSHDQEYNLEERTNSTSILADMKSAPILAEVEVDSNPILSGASALNQSESHSPPGHQVPECATPGENISNLPIDRPAHEASDIPKEGETIEERNPEHKDEENIIPTQPHTNPSSVQPTFVKVTHEQQQQLVEHSGPDEPSSALPLNLIAGDNLSETGPIVEEDQAPGIEHSLEKVDISIQSQPIAGIETTPEGSSDENPSACTPKDVNTTDIRDIGTEAPHDERGISAGCEVSQEQIDSTQDELQGTAPPRIGEKPPSASILNSLESAKKQNNYCTVKLSLVTDEETWKSILQEHSDTDSSISFDYDKTSSTGSITCEGTGMDAIPTILKSFKQQSKTMETWCTIPESYLRALFAGDLRTESEPLSRDWLLTLLAQLLLRQSGVIIFDGFLKEWFKDETNSIHCAFPGKKFADVMAPLARFARENQLELKIAMAVTESRQSVEIRNESIKVLLHFDQREETIRNAQITLLSPQDNQLHLTCSFIPSSSSLNGTEPDDHSVSK